MPGSRKRPDGRVLNWTGLRLKNEFTTLFPFFIQRVLARFIRQWIRRKVLSFCDLRRSRLTS